MKFLYFTGHFTPYLHAIVLALTIPQELQEKFKILNISIARLVSYLSYQIISLLIHKYLSKLIGIIIKNMNTSYIVA